jgi:hypothetical protein
MRKALWIFFGLLALAVCAALAAYYYFFLKPTATTTTAPGAPTGVSASASNGSASVTFVAPVSTGGAIITLYTVTASPGGAHTTTTSAVQPATMNGLTNGTAYTFTVTATNSVGTSVASVASTAVTPLGSPGAPTNVTSVSGNGQATVAFVAPTDNGGAPITQYIVTASPGGVTSTSTGATTGVVVSGLTNGTAYTFTVTATNSAGTSGASVASTAVTPLGPPDAPTNVTCMAGSSQVTVSFVAPANTGGTPITLYTVTASPSGATIMSANVTTGLVVTGLTNGTTYTFSVTATNNIGVSVASVASTGVVPVGLPGPPTAITCVSGNSQATVSFVAPTDNGGTPITQYTVTSSPGGVTSTSTGATTGIVVSGLTNGTAYTFTVTANNKVGMSVASVASTGVVPLGLPGPPTGVTSVAGNGQLTVSFVAPTNSGGTSINQYIVTASPGGAATTSTGSTTTGIVVAGLANGTAYTVTVTAINSVGTSIASVASLAVTPVGPPGSPTNVTGIAGNGQATISFIAPSATGGSPITLYTVTASSGKVTNTTITTGIVVTGLTNGTAYTFTVTATNSAGTSSSSSASTSVTPQSGPPAPTSLMVTGGSADKSASVAFTLSTGAVSYKTVAMPGNFTATGSTSPLTVSGLAYGTTYAFTVTAIDSNGISGVISTAASFTVLQVPLDGNYICVISGQYLNQTWYMTIANGAVSSGSDTKGNTYGPVAFVNGSGTGTAATSGGSKFTYTVTYTSPTSFNLGLSLGVSPMNRQ